ncbi:MFS transporter [Rugosimonospora africana]|uniref:MFS transporter n=1 Tax=Rugosimonospora africana TaxID=556532 RepID=A0A8J3VQI7_9ACTN|nr:MFS transporter [Rugosimonospora africana]GIH14368.1 MFS transporter [Rugosimonospora africana]
MIATLMPARGTPRILVIATLVNTFGNGAYLTTSALFLTHSVGLSPAQVAIGLSTAALAGIVLTTPMGYLVDRVGPRGLQVAALLTSAASFTALTLVRDLWSFIPLACLIAVGDATAKASNSAMIAAAVPPDQRVRTRAFVRSANNGGIALGTLAGGVPLLLDSRAGYLAVLLLNSVTYLVAAFIVTRANRTAPPDAPVGGPRMVTLRDRPFLAFALVDGLVMALLNGILSLALPLWLVGYTHAPTTLVTAALLVNTIGCVTMQVWVSRGTHGAADAIPVSRRGAFLVAASCVLFGLTAGRSSWLVGVLVLLAAAVHVLGELWLSSGSFAVVFGLAPDWAQGQYQGAYQTGRQIGNMAAPPLLTALVVGSGVPGWIGIAAIFAAAGVVYPHIIRRGLRRVEAGRVYAEAASAA